MGGLPNPFQCFIQPLTIMFKGRSVQEVTQQTIDQIQHNIDDINNKIQAISTERQMAVDGFNQLKKCVKGVAGEHEKHQMRVFLMRKKEADDHLTYLNKQLHSMYHEQAKVRGFVYVTATAAATSDIQRSMNKLRKHYDPSRMHEVMDARSTNIQELQTFSREMENRLDTEMSPEMDVDAELEQELDKELRMQLMDTPVRGADNSVAVKEPPRYSDDKQSLLVKHDLYSDCY